jgi:hypothetical protein
LTVALPDLSLLGQFSSIPQASNDDDSAGRIRIFLLWGEEKQRQRIKRFVFKSNIRPNFYFNSAHIVELSEKYIDCFEGTSNCATRRCHLRGGVSRANGSAAKKMSAHFVSWLSF